MAQNPGSVKAREEVLRLTKKIKMAEAEVANKHAQAARQEETFAKLQADIDKINAGAAGAPAKLRAVGAFGDCGALCLKIEARCGGGPVWPGGASLPLLSGSFLAVQRCREHPSSHSWSV